MSHFKTKMRYLLVSIVMVVTLSVLALPRITYAAPIPPGCPNSPQQGPPAPGVCEAIPPGCPGATRPGTKAAGTVCPYEVNTATSELGGPGSSGVNDLEPDCKPPNGVSLAPSNCRILGYIVMFTNILSAVVGIVIVLMITVGGVQYAAAASDPGAVAAARKRIYNALLALVFYIFMFSFLQWLVPGGVFNS